MLHLAERAALVGHVTIDAVELRVVPDVEEVASEFHAESLGKLRRLVEADVPIIEAWAAADRPRRVSDGAQRWTTCTWGWIVVEDAGIESEP